MTGEQMATVMCVSGMIEFEKRKSLELIFVKMTFQREENEPHNNKSRGLIKVTIAIQPNELHPVPHANPKEAAKEAAYAPRGAGTESADGY